ncbi:MAG: tetratricopeptide repeat protein [Alphaproteobacteria bacterium]
MPRHSALTSAATTASLVLALALLATCVPQSELPPSTPVAQAPAPAPQTQLESPLGSYLAGRFARSGKDIEAAADFYAMALAEDPDNVALLRRTFFLFVADGRIDEAMPLADKVVEQSPRTGMAYLVAALGDFKKGDYESVLERLKAAPGSGFNTLLVPLLSAWALAAGEHYDAAVAALEALTETESFASFRAFHGALIHNFAGRDEAAEAAFREAVEETSGGTQRMIEAFGSFLEQNGRGQEARELYLEYLERRPDNPVISDTLARLDKGISPRALVADPSSGVAEALFDVASALAQDNAQDAAQNYSRLALFMQPDLAVARTLLGELFEGERRWDDAIETYDEIGRDSPYGWNARLRVASALDRVDRTDEAVERLREMAAERSGRIEALVTLADILRGRERYQEAVDAYDSMFERISELEERHWSLLYARGIALERSRQWSRAEADFLHALELKPDQPLVLNYLGYSWVEQGDNLERALGMIEKAVELRPNDGYIVDSLGWVYYRMGSYVDAVEQLERAVELRPEDPTINDHLGDAYWRVDRINEARFQWLRALSFTPDEELVPAIEAKLKLGLTPREAAKEGS